MSEPIRVFIGTDESQEVAQAVLRHSIRARTKAAVEFTDLRGLASGLEGEFYTGFSFYRWAIPSLCQFKGRAIYVDADIVFQADIADLWNLPLNGHTHLARPRPEFDQSYTSVMLLDCGRLAHWKFDEWVERAKNDRDFYKATMWCEASGPTRPGIGPLPAEWNHLDEWHRGVTKAIHYTKVRDQPWKRPGHPDEHVFFDALRAAVAAGEVTRELLESGVASGSVYPGLLAAVGLASRNGKPAAGPVAVERLDACPICDGRRLERWCAGRDRLLRTNDQEFVYARCAACGVVFQSVRPSEGEVAAYYPDGYGPFMAEGSGEAATPMPSEAPQEKRASERKRSRPFSVKRRFKRTMAEFYDALQPGTTFLDYGCGGGAYLDRAKASGCKTIGVDVSPVARSRVEAKGHLALSEAPQTWDAIPDASVHFVRMNHVLEHLYRPREALTGLARKMAPGARIHLALPNPDGWTARAFRSLWHGLDCPRHAILYPPAALRAILVEAGFRDIRVIQEPVTKDHLRSWGYLFESLGWMRPGSAESMRNVRAFRRIASMPAAVAVLAGRSDRIHALAVR